MGGFDLPACGDNVVSMWGGGGCSCRDDGCDLFVLSWARVRRVRRVSIFSELIMCGGDVLIDRVWSSKECVYCACDPSVNLDVPSIGFLYICGIHVMSEGISSFRGLRAGSLVFALLMLFLCVILHNMWSGKSMQLLCILHFDLLSSSGFMSTSLALMRWSTSHPAGPRDRLAQETLNLL